MKEPLLDKGYYGQVPYTPFLTQSWPEMVLICSKKWCFRISFNVNTGFWPYVLLACFNVNTGFWSYILLAWFNINTGFWSYIFLQYSHRVLVLYGFRISFNVLITQRKKNCIKKKKKKQEKFFFDWIESKLKKGFLILRFPKFLEYQKSKKKKLRWNLDFDFFFFLVFFFFFF